MIVIGSRGSELALAQSRQVAKTVAARTGEEWRIEIIKTRGDAIIDRPLPEVGGKGLFTMELEEALREGRIDLAVHSLKDLPVEDPEGLTLGAVPERVDPCDVLVYDRAQEDPEGGSVPLLDGRKIGSSSPRRRAALLRMRPDLELADIRGNVPTRAGKVEKGEYAATVLAAAGIGRLGLDLAPLGTLPLPVERCVPAPGQGALGLQCRKGDERIIGLLQSIHHEDSRRCVTAERDVLLGLGGGCSMPLGVLVRPRDEGGFHMIAGLYGSVGAPAEGVFVELVGDDPQALTAEAIELLRPLVGDPLQGKKIALIRPGGGDSRMVAQLAVAGAEVDTIAVSEALPIPLEAGALDALREGVALAFGSARGVDRLCEEAAMEGIDLRGREAFAVGPATAEALRIRGLVPICPEKPGGGRQMGQLVKATLPAGSKVLFPAALDSAGTFEAAMADSGIEVIAAPAYRIESLPGVEWPRDRYDALVYTAPSAVKAAGQIGPPQSEVIVAIGTTTAAALDGQDPLVATSPTPEAIRDLLIARFA